MKKIRLSQNKFAIVDNEDFFTLNQWKWYASLNRHTNSFVAVRNFPRTDGRQGAFRMSRVITNAPKGMVVDHINHDTLDNRRQNLRVCTNQENSLNKRRHKITISGFKGVFPRNDKDKWIAFINYNGKRMYLGDYNNKEEAAKAYDEAAHKFHGVFARLNFV